MSTAAASDGLLSIGEVLHLLRADFPDISISKIRYLEGEGLVEPSRTPSGYRKFSRADAERLRYVLRMQRDHYLPLKVIREHLDAIDRGLAPAPLSAADAAPRALVVAESHPTPEDLTGDSHELRLSRRELLEQAGITDDVLRELESFGLVVQGQGTSYYDATPCRCAGSPRRCRSSGTAPGTCARSSWLPSASWPSSSRWCDPCRAGGTRTRSPGPRRPRGRSPRWRCSCTSRW